jgi:outer membrane protein assembly factor BamB
LFTFSITSVLSAWEADKGTLLWRREYSEEFKPSHPLYGTAASPLVWEDRCFVAFGASGREGVKEKGAMMALRVSDGSEIWRWDGDGPALAASPVIAVIEGAPQLVSKAEENIVGLDPQTGKELWRIPFKVTQDNTIVTPLIMRNRLLTSDAEKGFSAWQIHRKGQSFGVQDLWTNRAVSLSMSSPVVVADQIVGYSHFNSGQLFGLDPSNGELLWRGEPRWGAYVNVSLISWGEELLVLRENGRLVVGKVTRSGFAPVRQYSLGSTQTWGHPAVVGGKIVIRDGSRLAVYRLHN